MVFNGNAPTAVGPSAFFGCDSMTVYFYPGATGFTPEWNGVPTETISDPVANAGPDQTIEEGAVVTFQGSATTFNMEVNNYTWTFTYDGDTEMLYGEAPIFFFDIPGNYNVTLNVSDAVGN